MFLLEVRIRQYGQKKCQKAFSANIFDTLYQHLQPVFWR